MVFCMREKRVPPIIAAECFQTHQRFVSGLTPKLSPSFEANLVLTAARFHSSAAQGFALLSGRPIVHPILVRLQIFDFLVHRLPHRAFQPLLELLHLRDDFATG
jgi:hypothetical protein